MLRDDNRICPLRVNLNGVNPSVEVRSELSLVLDPQSKYSALFEMSNVIHCEGLLLCINRDDSRMVIWNPLTGETSRRINIHKKSRYFCLGYSNKSCNNKSYKILSYYSSSNDGFEIYEFETDSWRVVVNDDVINAPGGWEFGGNERSVSLNGNIYMFADDKTETPSSLSLLKFDFSTEKSLLVPLPNKCHRFMSTSLCVVREEKLSVSLQLKPTSMTEIWLTNKIHETTKEVSWSKVLALDLSCVDIFISDYGNFLLDEEKKMVVFFDRWNVDERDETNCKDMLFIVGEDNKITRVDAAIDTHYKCWPAILDYVPSLVHIDQAD